MFVPFFVSGFVPADVRGVYVRVYRQNLRFSLLVRQERGVCALLMTQKATLGPETTTKILLVFDEACVHGGFLFWQRSLARLASLSTVLTLATLFAEFGRDLLVVGAVMRCRCFSDCARGVLKAPSVAF